MARQNKSPYICHVFVCTNDHAGTRKSCADGHSTSLRAALKEIVDNRGWKPYVRVTKCGCMGLCADGPNVIMYPQSVWFSETSTNDVGIIISKIEEILKEST